MLSTTTFGTNRVPLFGLFIVVLVRAVVRCAPEVPHEILPLFTAKISAFESRRSVEPQRTVGSKIKYECVGCFLKPWAHYFPPPKLYCWSRAKPQCMAVIFTEYKTVTCTPNCCHSTLRNNTARHQTNVSAVGVTIPALLVLVWYPENRYS